MVLHAQTPDQNHQQSRTRNVLERLTVKLEDEDGDFCATEKNVEGMKCVLA